MTTAVCGVFMQRLCEFDKIAWSDFGRRERVGPKGCGQDGRSNPSRRLEQIEVYGEVAERSKAHAWKVCNT